MLMTPDQAQRSSSAAHGESASFTAGSTGARMWEVDSADKDDGVDQPEGVYKGWGDAAARHGVVISAKGVFFGNTLHTNWSGEAFDLDEDGCPASVAPGINAHQRSKWCPYPTLCEGYEAHQPKEGTSASDWETAPSADATSYPDDAEVITSPWGSFHAEPVPWEVPASAAETRAPGHRHDTPQDTHRHGAHGDSGQDAVKRQRRGPFPLAVREAPETEGMLRPYG